MNTVISSHFKQPSTLVTRVRCPIAGVTNQVPQCRNNVRCPSAGVTRVRCPGTEVVRARCPSAEVTSQRAGIVSQVRKYIAVKYLLFLKSKQYYYDQL